MVVAEYVLPVQLPSVDEFAQRFPQYGGYARGDGEFLFRVVMTPESFNYARVATLVFGLPAVAGVAEACVAAVEQQNVVEWRDFIKQYIGALVCVLMEANGFEKTGVKRAVPHKKFTKGEVYHLAAIPSCGDLAQQLVGVGQGFSPERDAVAELVAERAAED